MKIVILGAGALGTVLGAHLARAGEDVALIARGQRAAYLQAHGATIKTTTRAVRPTTRTYTQMERIPHTCRYDRRRARPS